MAGIKAALAEISKNAFIEMTDAIVNDFLDAGFTRVKFVDNHSRGCIDFANSSVSATLNGKAYSIELSHTGYSYSVKGLSSASTGAVILRKKLEKLGS